MKRLTLQKQCLLLLLSSALALPTAFAADTENYSTTISGPQSITTDKPVDITVTNAYAIHAKAGNVTLTASDVSINSNTTTIEDTIPAVFVESNQTAEISATAGNISGHFNFNDASPALFLYEGTTTTLSAPQGNIDLNITTGKNRLLGLQYANKESAKNHETLPPAQLTLSAQNISLSGNSQILTNRFILGKSEERPKTLDEWNAINIGLTSTINIHAQDSNTIINKLSNPKGISSLTMADNSTTNITADTGNNTFTLQSANNVGNNILGAINGATINISAEQGKNILNSSDAGILAQSSPISLTANENLITTQASFVAWSLLEKGTITITAQKNNILKGFQGSTIASTVPANKQYGVINAWGGKVDITAGNDNVINSQLDKTHALNATNGGNITVTAEKQNTLTSKDTTIIAEDSNTAVTIKGLTSLTSATANGAIAKTQATITLDALQSITAPISALRAGQIDKSALHQEVTGDTEEELKKNELYTDETINKRTVTTDKGDKEQYYFVDETPLNLLLDTNQATLTSHYTKNATLTSPVIADVGTLTLTPKDGDAKMTHTSQGPAILAINKGTVNYTLAQGSSLTGYAYNFMDLESTTQDSRETKIQEEFRYNAADVGSKEVIKTPDYIGANNKYEFFSIKPGTINLTLENDAHWTNTQQSTITTLSGAGSIAVSDTASRTMGNALHIDTLAGTHTFQMHLEKVDNATNSDILYIKNGQEEQNLSIINDKALFDSMKQGDYVRVATITKSNNNEFGPDKKVYYRNAKGLKATTILGTYSHNSLPQDTEEAYNQAYNGTAWTDGKPGNDFVITHYGASTDVTNYYLFCEETATPTVLTIPSTYNAIYGLISQLDTLNKRQGEIRYDEGNTGWWARSIQTNLNKRNSYDLSGHAYELGYDTTAAVDSPNVRVRSKGFFLHYGTYNTEHIGLDTNGQSLKLLAMGAHQTARKTNGSYYDLVVRIGQLQSDYHVGTPSVTGKYKQNLFQLSAEVGRQYIHNHWTLEPQAQLQYTHLGGASYHNSDDVYIQMQRLHSLIGRLGLRVTRLLSTERDEIMYAYCNIEHDFLGTRNTIASDNANEIRTQTRDGITWYTAGLGYSRPIDKDLFAAASIEKRFGHGYHGTRYDINVKYKF